MRYEQRKMKRNEGMRDYRAGEDIRRIEFYKPKMTGEEFERAERTIAELESKLPHDWRYKHLTGPAAQAALPGCLRSGFFIIYYGDMRWTDIANIIQNQEQVKSVKRLSVKDTKTTWLGVAAIAI